MKISGYKRADGNYGIRNHLVILPTSICSSEVAVRISQRVSGSVALPHQLGCCQAGKDHQQTLNTLIGFGRNPNVGAVLVVGLGCEGVRPDNVVEKIKESGKIVNKLIIQESGGSINAIEKGVEIASSMAEILLNDKKVEFDISEIVVALECGGSDPTSGIASNPAVGVASDILIQKGGTSILSETTELIGAEHILAKRAINEDVANMLLSIVKRTEQRAIEMGEDLRGSQPTPGNIEGGLSTIEEKSLGCIYKAGNARIQGVLEYGERPKSENGLYIMDTPGHDIDSITGMLAGGAQIVLFTTGRGTPTGSPIAPVIKITGNGDTYRKMKDNIDINAGKIIEGNAQIDEIGEEIFSELLKVANGKLTKSERLGHREFSIFKIGYTF